MRMWADIRFARVVWTPKRLVSVHNVLGVNVKLSRAGARQFQHQLPIAGQYNDLVTSGRVITQGGNQWVVVPIFFTGLTVSRYLRGFQLTLGLPHFALRFHNQWNPTSNAGQQLTSRHADREGCDCAVGRGVFGFRAFVDPYRDTLTMM
jgi:hypothetical protein